jgi:hypothetical protein
MSDNNFIVINRQDIDRNVWDTFVDLSEEAWLWHRYDLQDALYTWPNRQDMSFAVVNPNQGNAIVAIVPFHLICYGVFRRLRLNKFDSTGGPACAPGLAKQYKRQILSFIVATMGELAKENFAYEITIAIPPMAPAFCGNRCPLVNPLLELGFENISTHTWVVNLQQGKDKLWQNMEKRARGAIRKAEKQGLSIHQAEDKDLDIYYTLHCETYHRTGVRPHPKAYFEDIWNNFLSKNLAYILIAEKNDIPVAAENFGIYKQAAIYWTGASSAQGLSMQVNSLLQWTAIQWLKDNNINFYETGEAFPHVTVGKLKGLNDFKKSFGGDLYPYYRGRMIINKNIFYLMNLLKRIR